MIREDIANALFKLFTGLNSVQWALFSRRLKLWDDVPAEQRPAFFLVEHHETYARSSEKLNKRVLEFNAFIYLNTLEGNTQFVSGGAQLNWIMDQIDAVLAPTGIDLLNSRNNNTLGGLVQHCYINGTVLKVPGDLDGDGLLVIPITALMP